MTAMFALEAQTKPCKQETRFDTVDTDSVPMGIDNRASGCILHVESDFNKATLKDCPSSVVKHFGGSRVMPMKIGTL
jgi:hypothetical protein